MTTLFSLENVKYTNQKGKDIVNGYVRNIQTLMPSDNVYYTVPTLVIHSILLYFYRLECFDPENYCKTFKLTNDNTLLTKKRCEVSLAYLSMNVSKGIHEWKFQIMHNYGNFWIEFGVWKTKHTFNTSSLLYQSCNNGKCYGWQTTDATTTNGDEEFERPYGCQRKCKTGDVIDMILYLNEF